MTTAFGEKYFVDINTKQKSISASLAIDLKELLYSKSDDPIKQMEGYRIRVAKYLGADKGSPLYRCVELGTTKIINKNLAITVTTIANSVETANFFCDQNEKKYSDSIKNNKKIAIIGHDSKTQNILNFVESDELLFSNLKITKVGKDELIIATLNK